MTRYFAFFAAATLLTCGPALAKIPLKEVAHVRDGLLIVGAANEIRKNCDRISPRILRAYTYMKGLERHASDLGYTDAEIEAYVENKAEKERLEAIVLQMLVKRGVDPSVPATYCSAGVSEISQGTSIGRLLKAD